MHWPIEDPASNDLTFPVDAMRQRFRAARDRFRERIAALTPLLAAE